MSVVVFDLLLPIVAGLLLAAAFPPFTASQAAWVALVPLVFAVDRGSARAAFRRGYLAGLVFFGATVWWTIHVTLIGTVALIAALAVYFGLGALWFWWVLRLLGLGRDQPGVATARAANSPSVGTALRAVRPGDSTHSEVTARSESGPYRPEIMPAGSPGDRDSVSRNLLLMFLAPAGWVVLEWVRGSFILGGFPWNFLGVSQHGVPHAIQYTAVTGVYGVSALLLLGNLGIYCTLRRLGDQLRAAAPRRRLSLEFYVAVAAMCLPLVHGARTIHRAAAAGEPLRLLLVQGNIPQNLKFDPAEKPMVLERYGEGTRAGLEFRQPDLVIWPETATPEALRYDLESYSLVTNLAATAGVPLLAGTIDYTPRSEPVEAFNAAMLVGPEGAIRRIYRKTHLVPFGEYVPLRKLFPFLAWLTPIPGSFERGTEYAVFELPRSGTLEEWKDGRVEEWNDGTMQAGLHPGQPSTNAPSASLPVLQPSARLLRFAVVICFEDTVPALYRRFVRQEVDFMVNLTNDAWFKDSPAAALHLANAVFRAVETRRPLVRATNNGVTCLVDQFGIVRHRLEPFREGILNAELTVPADPTATFYTRHGDVFVGLCAAVCLLAAAWSWRRRLAGGGGT